MRAFIDGPEAANAAAPSPERRFVVTNVRISPQHLEALQREALARKVRRGGQGKADASEVLRDVLDAWIAAGGTLPGR
jgi:hypothetical protein